MYSVTATIALSCAARIYAAATTRTAAFYSMLSIYIDPLSFAVTIRLMRRKLNTVADVNEEKTRKAHIVNTISFIPLSGFLNKQMIMSADSFSSLFSCYQQQTLAHTH